MTDKKGKKQKQSPIYETSKKEFQELLNRACQPILPKKPKKKPDSRQSET
jgi:hypothetical protein